MTEAQDALDVSRGLAKLETVKAALRRRLPTGNEALKVANIQLNMWRVNVARVHTRVHVLVFDFDRINPRTGKVLSLKKDQKYQP